MKSVSVIGAAIVIIATLQAACSSSGAPEEAKTEASKLTGPGC